MSIKWQPLQDNHIEGTSGETKLYIRMKKVGISTLKELGIEPEEGKREKLLVESLYIVPKEGEKQKITSQEYSAYDIESMKSVAESILNKRIEVAVYGGKVINYTDAEIQEMINNPGEFYGADNLPRWMRENMKITEKKVESFLKKIVAHHGNVKINVASDSFDHGVELIDPRFTS